MKIKKYETSNMKEALQIIKQDLGPDAVILSTRKVMKNNNFGLFGKQVLEVTAAVDYKTEAHNEPQIQSKPRTANPAYSPYLNDTSVSQGTKNFQSVSKPESVPFRSGVSFTEEDLMTEKESDILNVLPEPVYTPQKRKPPEFNEKQFQENNKLEEKLIKILQDSGLNKFNELLQEVSDLKKQIGDMKNGMSDNLVIDLPRRLKEYHNIFIKNGVDNLISYRFLKRVEQRLQGAPSNVQIRDMVLEMLAGIITVIPDYSVVLQKRVLALVGPTGVGKTTTIAKIAATMALKYKKRVCLVTIDNFRIGAVEQLKTYAEIVNIPLYVATNRDEFRRIIKETEGKYDCILVDSMGRGQFDTNQIESIKSILTTETELNTALVLSLASNHSELGDTLDRYSVLDPDYLIFTKLDETRYFGPLINLPVLKRIPLLLITTGQNVPDDMEEPNGKKIAKKVLQDIPTLWGAK